MPGDRTGIPNKNKKFLLKRLQDMYGEDFHPIMKMAENAHKAQQLVDNYDGDDTTELFTGLKFAVDAWDKVANYTEPKLKATELSGQVDQSLTVVRKEYKKDE